MRGTFSKYERVSTAEIANDSDAESSSRRGNVSERFQPRKYTDHADGFDWAIVFGGDKKKVKKVRAMEKIHSGLDCLEDNLRNLKCQDTGLPLLRVRREEGRGGNRIALLVGADDEGALLRHARRIGFRKKVINVDLDPEMSPKKLVKLESEQDIFERTSPNADHTGWSHNYCHELGKDMGFHEVDFGPKYENLEYYACKSWLSKKTGERVHEFFDSSERQRLVMDIMENEMEWRNEEHAFGLYKKKTGTYHLHVELVDAEQQRVYDVAKEKVCKGIKRPGGTVEIYLEEVLALNNPKELPWLIENWGDWKEMCGRNIMSQPLDAVAQYYGTKVGLYFAWLQFYTRYLVWPSIFGVYVFAIQIHRDVQSPNGLGKNLIYHSIFISLWATIFTCAWKRYENQLKHDWGSEGFEDEEEELPDFSGQVDDRWYSPVPEAEREVVKSTWNYARYGITGVALFMLIFGVLASCAFALFIKAVGSEMGQQCDHQPLHCQIKIVDEAGNTTTDFCRDEAHPRQSVAMSLSHTNASSNATFSNSSGTDGCIASCEGSMSMPRMFSYLGSLINVGFVIIFSQIYDGSAHAINRFENYRTQTEYDDALILKSFAFQSVNFYFLLFYLAFATVGHFPMTGNGFAYNHGSFAGVGWDQGLTSACRAIKLDVPDNKGRHVIVPDCMKELNVQLVLIFGVKTLIGQIKEIMIPWVKTLLKSNAGNKAAAEGRVAPVSKGVSAESMLEFGMQPTEMSDDDEALISASDKSWEERCKETGIYWDTDMHKEQYPGTYDEYKEMSIQFGFMTIFAVAMPIAAFLACLNNITEIRVDGSKMLTSFRRPHFREAEDIGSWFTVLTSLSVVAVITNALIIGFVSTVLVQEWFEVGWIDKKKYCNEVNNIGSRYTEPLNMYFVLIMEHCIFFFKFVLTICIPSESSRTKRDKSDLAWFVNTKFIKRGLH